MEKTLIKILDKLGNIEEEQQAMRKDIAGMKSDIVGMKSDIAEIKEEQQAMKNDMSEMRKDISRMEKDIARIDTDMSGMKSDMSGMKSDMSGMKKRQEESYLIISAILERTNINNSLEENISIVKAENERMFYQMNEYVRKDRLLEELKKAL